MFAYCPNGICSVADDREYLCFSNLSDENEPIMFQITDLVRRGNLDSALIVLKKRLWVKILKSPVSICVVEKLIRNSSSNPSVHATVRGEPNAALLVRQKGPEKIPQTLLS